MKALLIARGAAFPKTHDLQILNDLCSQHSILLGIDPRRQLHDLSEYVVRVSYPGEYPILEEAKRAGEIAKSIRSTARKFLADG